MANGLCVTGASSEAGTPVLDEGIGFDWNKGLDIHLLFTCLQFFYS
jgi:hypothetical protein